MSEEWRCGTGVPTPHVHSLGRKSEVVGVSEWVGGEGEAKRQRGVLMRTACGVRVCLVSGRGRVKSARLVSDPRLGNSSSTQKQQGHLQCRSQLLTPSPHPLNKHTHTPAAAAAAAALF